VRESIKYILVLEAGDWGNMRGFRDCTGRDVEDHKEYPRRLESFAGETIIGFPQHFQINIKRRGQLAS